MRLAFDLDVTDKGANVKVREFDTSLRKLDKTTGKTTQRLHGMGSTVKNMVGHMFSLKGAVVGVLAAMGVRRMARAASDWIKLAGAQEVAETSFRQAAISAGKYSDIMFKAAKENAKALQTLTGAGDEAILAGQKFLITYDQISSDLMPRVTKAMLDYAAFTGTDVPQAAKAMGKAAMGMLGELKRVGIQVDENAYKTKGFLGVLEQLEAQVGGQAEAFRQTVIGQWKAFGNAIGDAKEVMGALISSVFTSTGLLNGLIKIIEIATDKLLEMKEKGDLAKWATFTAKAVLGSFKAIGYSMQVVFNIVMILIRAVAQLKMAWETFGVAVIETGIKVSEFRKNLAEWGKDQGLLGKALGILWSEKDEKSLEKNKALLIEQTQKSKDWLQITKDLAGAQPKVNQAFNEFQKLISDINVEWKEAAKNIKTVQKDLGAITPILEEQKEQTQDLQKVWNSMSSEGTDAFLDNLKSMLLGGEQGFDQFFKRILNMFKRWGDQVFDQTLKPLADYIKKLFVPQTTPSFGMIHPFTGIPAMTQTGGQFAPFLPYLGAGGLGAGIGYQMGGTPGAIGGGLGAIGGMALGAKMGAWGGPIGMGVGAIAGGLLGGLFGKKKKKKAPSGPTLSDQIKDEVIAGIGDAFIDSTKTWEFQSFKDSLTQNLFSSVKTGISKAFAAEVFAPILGPGSLFMEAFTGMGQMIQTKGAKGGDVASLMATFVNAFDGLEETMVGMEPLWEVVTERLRGLEEALGFNTQALEASTQIEQFLKDLQFGALAPVQSQLAYELEYQRLLSQAQEKPGGFGELSQFLKGSYLPFMQAYGGDYATLVEAIRQDVTAMPWYQQQIAPIHVVLEVDGKVLGDVIAEQIGTNPNLQLALQET